MKEITKENLRSSRIFLVLGNKAFFDDPPREQIDYAKFLKKPFRVLLFEGVEPYEGFRDGVDDYREIRCNEENFNELVPKILEGDVDLKKRKERK